MLGSFRKASSRYRRVGISVFLILLLAGGQPWLWLRVESQAVDLQQARSQEQQIEDLRRRNTEMQQAIDAQADFVSQLDVVAPPSSQLTQIVERVEQLADNQNLRFSIANITQTSADGGAATDTNGFLVLDTVSMSVTVTGPISRTLAYLEAIEHVPELSVIQSWSLRAGGQQQATGPEPPVFTPEDPVYTLSLQLLFFLSLNDHGNDA